MTDTKTAESSDLADYACLSEDPEFSDKYELISLLGKGGMSAVLKARDRALDRVVAIKVLHPHAAVERNAIVRFRREAAILAALKHPNIIQIRAFGIAKVPYLVLEYLEGKPLGEFRAGNTVDPETFKSLFLPLLDGLAYAHKNGVLHRDIKPDNLFVVSGQPQRLVLVDFGISKIFDDEEKQSRHSATRDGVVIGTPAYMSPEQVMGGQLDQRTDIYSTCQVMYEVLSGCPSHKIDDNHLSAIIARLNEPVAPMTLPDWANADALNAVILKGLRLNPDQRYQFAEELKSDLEIALNNGVPTNAGQDETPVPSPKVTIWQSPAVIAILACTAIATAIIHNYHPTTEPPQHIQPPSEYRTKPMQTSASDADGLFTEGESLEKNGQFRPAIAKYKESIQQATKRHQTMSALRAQRNLAVMYMRDETLDLPQAEALCTEALRETAPDSATHLEFELFLARILTRQGASDPTKLDTAEKTYLRIRDKATASNAASFTAKACVGLGLLAFNKKDFRKAESYFTEVIDLLEPSKHRRGPTFDALMATEHGQEKEMRFRAKTRLAQIKLMQGDKQAASALIEEVLDYQNRSRSRDFDSIQKDAYELKAKIDS